MKDGFKDFPKLTSVGNYQVNHDIRYLLETFDRYIKQGLQLNPDFQRGHVWVEQQQIDYVEYFLKGGKSGRVIYLNHPNWLGNFKGDFVCVDGLQRITALTRFLNNEIKAFNHFWKEFAPISVDLITNINNLKTRAEVLQWYIELNEGGTVHSKKEIDRVRGMKVEEMLKAEK